MLFAPELCLGEHWSVAEHTARVRDARGEHTGHVVPGVQVKAVPYLKTGSYRGCLKSVGGPGLLLQLALRWDRQEEDAFALQSLSSAQGAAAAGAAQSRVRGIVSEPRNSTPSPRFKERKELSDQQCSSLARSS